MVVEHGILKQKTLLMRYRNMKKSLRKKCTKEAPWKLLSNGFRRISLEIVPHEQTKVHTASTTVPTSRSPGPAIAVVAPDVDPPEAVGIVAFTYPGPQS